MKITNETFVCQNKDFQFDDLCIALEAKGGLECETESKAQIDL